MKTFTKTFSILSIDQEFWHLIKVNKNKRHIGTIHSVFNQVINFKALNSQIYSIVHHGMGNGPYSMRVNVGLSFLDLNIKVGDLVTQNDMYLVINDFKLEVNHPKIWVPTNFKVNEKHLSIFLENLKIFNKILFSNRSFEGTYYYYIKKYVPLSIYDQASVIEKELSKRILSFLWSIQHDQQNLEKYITDLIGFGYGLTPSGDDFLVGFLTALNKISNAKAKSVLFLITNILQHKKISTTDISKMMIQTSLQGKVNEKVNHFMNCLLNSQDEDLLKRSILNVFSIGSSSGTDLSIGIIEGIRFSLISKNDKL